MSSANLGYVGQGLCMGGFVKNFKRHLVRTAATVVLCGAAISWSSAGFAKIDLSQRDLSHIGAAVDKAINDVKAALPAGSSRAQIDAAIAKALASETEALISEYRGENAMLITEAVITAALDDGAPAAAIGEGLADAALAEGPTVGLQIADGVGSTAPRDAVKIFEATADASGTGLGSMLASAAGSYETIGAGGNRGGNGTQMSFGNHGGATGAGTGGGGGCKNPSCT